MKNNYKSSQSSIRRIYKKEEEKEKKRELEEKGFCPISIIYPKRAKENQKLSSSPHQISKGLLEKSKEDHLKPRKLTYNVFFKLFKSATSDN